jgi:hypothetical protein
MLLRPGIGVDSGPGSPPFYCGTPRLWHRRRERRNPNVLGGKDVLVATYSICSTYNKHITIILSFPSTIMHEFEYMTK